MSYQLKVPGGFSDLPNGFHDAELHELCVGVAKAEVRLRLEFWTGDLDATTEEEREARRVGLLRLDGVTSTLIEPPAAGYKFTTGSGVFLDGDGPYPGDPAPPHDGLVRLWFYVSTWNSRMMFAAKTCTLEWVGLIRFCGHQPRGGYGVRHAGAEVQAEAA